jgi:ribosomal protein S12 methylthiotransferase
MGARTDSKKTVALISLGCAKNLVDSEVMLGALKAARYAFVTNPREADLVVVNTCGFIRPARDEAEEAIRRLIRAKAKHPGQRLAVVGCYVVRDRERLKRLFPEVDLWLGVGAFDRIADAARGGSFREPSRTFLYDHRHRRLLSTSPGTAYIKISEGCSHRCSFCAIPLIKGRYRSRTVSSIAAEARAMALLGVKEINIISHDTTFFGRDRGVHGSLVKLLRRLIGVHGIEWIRLLYGYPEEITDDLLEVIQEKKVCPYLDIPFQHAEKKIVRSMRRSTDGTGALALIEKIRKRVPGIALRTSLIVGFPGEGAAEFHILKQFVREARFEHLGVFTYSRESGTPAYNKEDRLTQEEKERRRSEIMEIQAAISLSHNRALIGSTTEVLVEKPWTRPNFFIGRTRRQAPEADGVLILDAKSSRGIKPGGIVGARITEADVYDLGGRIRP